MISVISSCHAAGVVLPLLQQSLLLWQVLVGYVLLGKRYAAIQIAGVLLVVSGVAKAAWPSGTGASVFSQVGLLPTYMCCHRRPTKHMGQIPELCHLVLECGKDG